MTKTQNNRIVWPFRKNCTKIMFDVRFLNWSQCKTNSHWHLIRNTFNLLFSCTASGLHFLEFWMPHHYCKRWKFLKCLPRKHKLLTLLYQEALWLLDSNFDRTYQFHQIPSIYVDSMNIDRHTNVVVFQVSTITPL